ncbi:tetratricopeptide repeat protein [Maribacter antarcticus]|uniref:tetratricopeptide repeat protein n=1 Tax=Maribacter antarcticus TaxID=505250 RepID=UPI00047CB9A6
MEKENLIDKYFAGSLSLEEQVLFENFLKVDSDFKIQFELEKNVKAAVKGSEREILKRKLQGFEEGRSVSSKTKNTFWIPLRIAASIVILLSASWFLFNFGFLATTDTLYDANYEQYPNTVYTITRGESNDTSIERKAFEAYESGEYQIAIDYLKKLKTETGLDYVDFYLGQSYLANGDTQEAIDTFEKIGLINSDYRAEALWYQALAYLKLEQNEKSITLLNILLKEGTYKMNAATNLLDKLE